MADGRPTALLSLLVLDDQGLMSRVEPGMLLGRQAMNGVGPGSDVEAREQEIRHHVEDENVQEKARPGHCQHVLIQIQRLPEAAAGPQPLTANNPTASAGGPKKSTASKGVTQGNKPKK